MVEERLVDAGYVHYETSAYARAGAECRHNLNYWRFGDYLGIGAGAHSKLSFHDRIVREMRYKQPARVPARASPPATRSQERHAVARRELGVRVHDERAAPRRGVRRRRSSSSAPACRSRRSSGRSPRPRRRGSSSATTCGSVRPRSAGGSSTISCSSSSRRQSEKNRARGEGVDVRRVRHGRRLARFDHRRGPEARRGRRSSLSTGSRLPTPGAPAIARRWTACAAAICRG